VVLADATQLHQIIMNLGTNAWHAMKRGGRLSVSLEGCVIDAEGARIQPRLRPGKYARVTIRDTGTGMDDATLRRIFEPFFTTKLPGEGTGLGLAMVHGIMDTHDGAVTVSSQPDVGTEFSLFFPEHMGRPLERANLTDPTPHGHGERILFVDDEEVLVQLGSRVLASLGYEPEVATDPTAALSMIAADPNRFALVLTDLTMPKLTGPNLASAIWAIRPNLPIILVTGYSAALTPERVESLGFCRLLLKPCGYHELGLAVHASLRTPAPIPPEI
jgi:CheY-like chemotaxis protein